MWRCVAGSNLWRLKEDVLLKRWKPLTQLHSVTSQKTWIRKKNQVRLRKMLRRNGWRIFICLWLRVPLIFMLPAGVLILVGASSCGILVFWFLSVLYKNTVNMLRQYSSGDWRMSVEHYCADTDRQIQNYFEKTLCHFVCNKSHMDQCEI